MRRLSRQLFDLPYLLLAFSPLCWAGNMVVGRAVRGEIPPFSINWWRWTIASAILLLFVRSDLWQQRALVLRHWKLVLFLAATGIAAFHSTVYIGLQSTTAINATLIIALGPVLILPMARILLQERMSALQLLGVLLSFVGVAVIITRAELSILLDLEFNRGDLWLLAGSAVWAIYSVGVKLKPAELKPLVLLVAILLLGALLNTPLYLWEIAQGRLVPLTLDSLAALGYVGIFAGVLAYISWNRGVELVGPNKAGLFLHLIPVYGAVLAFLFLGERLQAFHFVGVAFIVTGIALTVAFAPKPATARA